MKVEQVACHWLYGHEEGARVSFWDQQHGSSVLRVNCAVSWETDQHPGPLLGGPQHHRGCTGSEQVHMLFCAPTPHKVCPSLCWDRTLHLSDGLHAADDIQAFQGTFPHQSTEGHHRRMFACYLHVSALPVSLTPRSVSMLDALSCVIKHW
jgi:hypothetical protein